MISKQIKLNTNWDYIFTLLHAFFNLQISQYYDLNLLLSHRKLFFVNKMWFRRWIILQFYLSFYLDHKKNSNFQTIMNQEESVFIKVYNLSKTETDKSRLWTMNNIAETTSMSPIFRVSIVVHGIEYYYAKNTGITSTEVS